MSEMKSWASRKSSSDIRNSTLLVFIYTLSIDKAHKPSAGGKNPPRRCNMSQMEDYPIDNDHPSGNQEKEEWTALSAVGDSSGGRISEHGYVTVAVAAGLMDRANLSELKKTNVTVGDVPTRGQLEAHQPNIEHDRNKNEIRRGDSGDGLLSLPVGKLGEGRLANLESYRFISSHSVFGSKVLEGEVGLPDYPDQQQKPPTDKADKTPLGPCPKRNAEIKRPDDIVEGEAEIFGLGLQKQRETEVAATWPPEKPSQARKRKFSRRATCLSTRRLCTLASGSNYSSGSSRINRSGGEYVKFRLLFLLLIVQSTTAGCLYFRILI